MNLDAAKKACAQAGWDADSISVVETEADVRRARSLGKVVVDTVCCLREPHVPTRGGGVFLVVRCENAYSREILHTKGLITNRARSVGMIYRPYHLCGVETPISIIAAARLGVATGARAARPRWDVIAVAKKDLKTGTVIGRDLENSDQLDSAYESHRVTKERNLLPLGMSGGLRLTQDVTVGMRLTEEVMEIPRDSLLWRLRREQDALFGTHSS